MEIKREADSNDIAECSHVDKPSVGTFVVVFFDAVFSAVISMCVVQLFSCCTCVLFICFASTYYTLQLQRLVLTPVDHISMCFSGLTVTCMISVVPVATAIALSY